MTESKYTGTCVNGSLAGQYIVSFSPNIVTFTEVPGTYTIGDLLPGDALIDNTIYRREVYKHSNGAWTLEPMGPMEANTEMVGR